MKVLEHTCIYRDEEWYSAFPSIVSRPDGELVVAFRRAPERRKALAPGISHIDPNSYLVLVRSSDLGASWSPEPELIWAHPNGGSQDPCMVQLRDGSILLTSYVWTLVPEAAKEHMARHAVAFQSWAAFCLGGYVLRSTDAGATWVGPIHPPPFEDDSIWFEGFPRYPLNRGAMLEGSDGRLYWAVVRTPQTGPGHTVLELLVSDDKGTTWRHASHMAADDKVVFNETSMIETRGGDLIAFVRTGSFDDHGVIIRSVDRGETWEPWQDLGVIGHPHHALALTDGRVFLIYGYRHEPYGIRARTLDPECRELLGDELVLRDDGGSGDLGYPWACLLDDGRILGVYYLNHDDGTRYIAGTFIEP